MKKIFHTISNIWRPAVYQGINQKSKYFEGWFFKLVDRRRKTTIAIIPGIFYGKDNTSSKAFIQIFWGNKNQLLFFEYPVDQFLASTDQFKINIENNFFSEKEMRLNLSSDKNKISGNLQFKELVKWPSSFTSPGAMGPYSFAPFMQCNHAVISMNHAINGYLKINDQKLDFSNGFGYTEKDWGKAFPDAYIWVQCNHFSDSAVSLFASIAKIPWITGSFRGFIIGFLYQNKVYRFATYTGANIEYLKIDDDIVEFQIKDKNNKLYVKAKRTHGVVLHAPYDQEFLQRASESLISSVEVKFWQIENGQDKLLFHEIGKPAAIDVNGDLQEIVG